GVRFSSGRGHAELTVEFDQASFPPEHPDWLRMYLAGDLGSSATLYQWLRTSVEGIEWLDARGKSKGSAPEIQIRPLGLSPDHDMLPPEGCGHRLGLLKE